MDTAQVVLEHAGKFFDMAKAGLHSDSFGEFTGAGTETQDAPLLELVGFKTF